MHFGVASKSRAMTLTGKGKGGQSCLINLIGVNAW
jgi:hypothetical protein